jgi:hypothetical protein
MAKKVIMKLNGEVVFGYVDIDLKEYIEAGKMFRLNEPYALYNTAEGVSPMPYEEYAVIDKFNSVDINSSFVTWYGDLENHKAIHEAYMKLTKPESTIIGAETPSIIT